MVEVKKNTDFLDLIDMDGKHAIYLFVICANITGTCANYHDVTYFFLFQHPCRKDGSQRFLLTKHISQEGEF